jgi:hypothetical protein
MVVLLFCTHGSGAHAWVCGGKQGLGRVKVGYILKEEGGCVVGGVGVGL